jgi:membrane AbrB-like protein
MRGLVGQRRPTTSQHHPKGPCIVSVSSSRPQHSFAFRLQQAPRAFLATFRTVLQTSGPLRVLGPWIVIVLAGFLGDRLGVPVAWLVVPMIASVVLSLSGVPPLPSTAPLFPIVQAIIGATLSATFTLDSLAPIAAHWFPIAIAVVAVLIVSILAGLVLHRLASIDVATAALGTIPGGASGMVAMSDELGGDARLVAFLQYARVVIVIISIAILARMLDPTAAELGQPGAGADGDPLLLRYALAVFVAGFGGWLGVRLRLPAGALVGAMVVGLVPGLIGIGPLAWPSFVLAGAYLILGSNVGARFDRSVIRRLWALLPYGLAFIAGLVAICAVIGWLLHVTTDIDLLTALLATSPGGIDAATIAALDTGANVAMVASIQMARLLLMVIAGPLIIRKMVARRAPPVTIASVAPESRERTS